ARDTTTPSALYNLSLPDALPIFAEGPKAHSWRTFQLAFILMQLPLLSEPAAPKRSGDLAKAQLLFFPTGGGKTEAYLGLAAYTRSEEHTSELQSRGKFVCTLLLE